MKHDREVDEPVVTRVDSAGRTIVRLSGATTTRSRAATGARGATTRWRSTMRSRTGPERGRSTMRSRSITSSRGAATVGATTVLGWVTTYCGVKGPNGGPGKATTLG